MRKHNGAEKLVEQNHPNVPDSSQKKRPKTKCTQNAPPPKSAGKAGGTIYDGKFRLTVMSGCFLRRVVGAETNDLDKRHGQAKNSDGLSEGLKTGFCPNGSPEQRGREDKATAEP